MFYFVEMRKVDVEDLKVYTLFFINGFLFKIKSININKLTNKINLFI
jgi:hypothetical protein